MASEAIHPDLILVPAGWFVMGSDTGRTDERPAHRVFVRDIAVARLPVTNREYAAFVARGQRAPRFWHDERFGHPNQPVVGVTWQNAMDYCDWLSRQLGRRLRLPTEAEWEKAARGGVEDGLYAWGSDIPEDALGRLLSEQPKDRPAPAGEGPVNPLGIGDMGWNVHEWCRDWYDATYYADAPAYEPAGPKSGSRRSSRGGAWRHHVKISRCAARSAIPPELEYGDYGFRVVAEVE